jgi:hypothetical protein
LILREIDLPPHRWKSDRPKRREPIFGSGALPLLGELLGFAFGICLLILIAVLGTHVRDMMFGEPPQAHQTPLLPGDSTIVDGYTIKRIN